MDQLAVKPSNESSKTERITELRGLANQAIEKFDFIDTSNNGLVSLEEIQSFNRSMAHKDRAGAFVEDNFLFLQELQPSPSQRDVSRRDLEAVAILTDSRLNGPVILAQHDVTINAAFNKATGIVSGAALGFLITGFASIKGYIAGGILPIVVGGIAGYWAGSSISNHKERDKLNYYEQHYQNSQKQLPNLKF